MNVVSKHSSKGRAEKILEVARELFLTSGWDGFSMEFIAELAGCSRPLVYKHFSCKEEILLALAIESKERRVALCERAVTLAGHPRERMLAVGEVELILRPRDLPIELMVASSRLRAKTSQRRQMQLRVLDVRAVSFGSNVIREAISRGDLKLPGSLRPEDFLFFMWSSHWGAASIVSSDMPLQQMGVSNPTGAVDLSLALLLDGYGWRPLSTEWDYKETRERVYREVFPDDYVRAVLGV